jgi:hypothetical protein
MYEKHVNFNEIPKSTRCKINANTWKSNGILGSIPLNNEQQFVEIDDILRGTPCNIDAKPLRSYETLRVYLWQIH